MVYKDTNENYLSETQAVTEQAQSLKYVTTGAQPQGIKAQVHSLTYDTAGAQTQGKMAPVQGQSMLVNVKGNVAQSTAGARTL